MKLIIAEKPALGRSIADAIPGNANGRDPIYKGDYCITWLYGHILTLQEPQDYDTAYEKWSMEQLPIYFENWKQKPSEGKEGRVEEIGNLLKQAELVIHAGDPDDEGQLLVDEVLRWFHYAGKVYRMDTANTTKAALSRALSQLQENAPREKDGWAAYARSVADLMIGVNMSRFFTCMNRGKTLSVGRVQTPTLGLVVARDELIEQHQKTTYYTITGTVEIDSKQIPYTLQLDKNDPRLTDGKLQDRKTAEALQDALRGKALQDIQIQSREEAEQPPLPFNLVKLQTYCGNTWGYDPQRVMDITQRLKDSGAITYNRSDCQYLSSDHFKEAPHTVPTICKNLSLDGARFDTGIKSAAFNDSYITAHFAIIPTNTTRDLSRFSEEERNVYRIIAAYYLAQFLPPCRRKKTTLKKQLEGIGTITSTSSEVLDPGFHTLLPAKQEPPTPLSGFADGTYPGTVTSAQVNAAETKPPARYTKTSLNEDMTRIAKYVRDEKVRQLLLEKDRDKKGENGSIGTSATRATIIDGLILRGFLVEKGRKLISTDMGREFYHVLPDEIKKPDMTAYWWVLQEQIKAGEITPDRLCASVLETINQILKQQFPLLPSAVKIPADRKIVGRCPWCGSYVVSGNKGYGCMNYKNGCKFTIWKKPLGSVWKNITISETSAKRLLQGETIATRKLWSEAKKCDFYGGYRLKGLGEDGTAQNPTPAAAETAGTLERRAELELVRLERPVLGTCPRCGGNVVEGKTGFGCSNYQGGCRFIIWKKAKGGYLQSLTITDRMAKKLLAGESIHVTRLKRNGIDRPLPGSISLRDTGSEYGADLEVTFDPMPSVGTCPRCGKPVVENALGFGCSGWNEGCKFTIWKHPKIRIFADIPFTADMAKQLLARQPVQTDLLYSEKKDKHFPGAIVLQDKGSPYGADYEIVLSGTEATKPEPGDGASVPAEEDPDDFHRLFEHLYDDHE